MAFLLFFFYLTFAQILEYRLWKNYGQLIYDYSGNNNHGTNGPNTLSTLRACLFTDRGVYLNSNCHLRFPDIPFPNPVSVVIWTISDSIMYPASQITGRLFCRWSQDKTVFVFHDKTALSVKLAYVGGTTAIISSSINTWKTSNLYLDEWGLMIIEINQKTIKIKRNDQTILQYIDSSVFNDDSDLIKRFINIGTDNNVHSGLGGFVWYVSIFKLADIERNFLGASSNNCFVGTCASCDPSFVIPSLGTGCASNSVSNKTDAEGIVCNSGYGCKGNLIIKCNCPSFSCEFTSGSECSCIDSTSNTKYQAACSCSSLGQGCCHDDCASCSIESKCLTCKASFTHIVDGKCLCNNGYFKNSLYSSLFCSQCNIECETCSSENFCTSCKEHLVLSINGICLCPDGYFKSITTSVSCMSCLSECSTCSDSTTCSSCKDPNAILENGRCVCTKKFFGIYSEGIFQTCEKCEDSCSQCLAIGQCLTCSFKNSVLRNGTCVCAEGYGTTSGLTSEDSCTICEYPCKTCSYPYYCLSCFQHGSEDIKSDCRCADGYYSEADKCLKCLNECKTCKDGKKCLSCKDEKATLRNDKKCKCEQGVYLNINGYCVACPNKCLNCSLNEENSIECFGCKEGFSLNSGYCFETCDLNQVDDDCLCPADFIKTNKSCEKQFLELLIEIQTNNSLDLHFSEDLKNPLNHSLISIESTLKDFSFKVTKKSQNFYVVSFEFKTTVAKNTAFKLKIDKSIQSSTNKTLKNHEFSLKFHEFEFIQKLFKEILKNVESGGQISNIIAMFFSMFSNPSSGWVLMNTLQMIYFLPLSKKPLTPVANKFCKAIGKSNTFSIPKLFLNPDCSDVPFEQARKIGIVSSSVWINLGQEVTIFIVILSFFPFLYLLSRCKIRIVSQKAKDLCKNYQYSFFFRFLLQSHLIFGVYSLINLESEAAHPNIESTINKTFSIIFIVSFMKIIFISTPAIILIILWTDLPLITSNNSKYIDQNGSLFQEFEYEKGMQYVSFYIILGIRRVVFVFSQIYLSDFEVLQRSLNLTSSVCLFVYLAVYRPFKVKIVMITNIFIEFLLVLVFCLILGRSFFRFLQNDYIFDLCFTSILIGGLVFQYFICFFSFVLKVKILLQQSLKKDK